MCLEFSHQPVSNFFRVGKYKIAGARDSNARPNSCFSQILSTTPQEIVKVNAWSICNFIIKKLKFAEKKIRKTHDFEKSILNTNP